MDAINERNLYETTIALRRICFAQLSIKEYQRHLQQEGHSEHRPPPRSNMCVQCSTVYYPFNDSEKYVVSALGFWSAPNLMGSSCAILYRSTEFHQNCAKIFCSPIVYYPTNESDRYVMCLLHCGEPPQKLYVFFLGHQFYTLLPRITKIGPVVFP